MSTFAVDGRVRRLGLSGGRRFDRGILAPALKLAAVGLVTGGFLLLAGQPAGAQETDQQVNPTVGILAGCEGIDGTRIGGTPAEATDAVRPEFVVVCGDVVGSAIDGTRIGGVPDDLEGTRIGGVPDDLEGTRIGGVPDDLDGTRIGGVPDDLDGTRIG